STLTASTLVFRLANSGISLATAPSSVVQTGVKSAGCENSTPQPFPRYAWKSISPAVVSAVKFGATSPRCSAIADLLQLASLHRSAHFSLVAEVSNRYRYWYLATDQT